MLIEEHPYYNTKKPGDFRHKIKIKAKTIIIPGNFVRQSWEEKIYKVLLRNADAKIKNALTGKLSFEF